MKIETFSYEYKPSIFFTYRHKGYININPSQICYHYALNDEFTHIQFNCESFIVRTKDLKKVFRSSWFWGCFFW